jgi:hypothetical protein
MMRVFFGLALEPTTSRQIADRLWHKPGIYWLGPKKWPEQLSRLAQKLNSLGSVAGAKRDRANAG